MENKEFSKEVKKWLAMDIVLMAIIYVGTIGIFCAIVKVLLLIFDKLSL